MNFFRTVLLSLILGCLVPAAQAAQQMKVPFNFQWGESPQRVEQSLLGIKAKIVERKIVQGRSVIVVEGIPQKLLEKTLFFFSNDSLVEIELQYGDSTWDSAKYAQFFDEIRQNIDMKYGPGRLVTREKTREGDVLQTLIGYQWIQSPISLRLFFFTADRDGESVRVMSLHYKEV
jgi:hypothetical protein